MEKELAPIVLFVYNRPLHTQKTIEGLLTNPEAKDSHLFIFADGPKKNADADCREKISQVREYIHSITGFKEVTIEEQTENRGLAASNIYGLTKIINKYGRVIMLEDDDVPCPYYLDYENRLLEKYKDDSRIWCIGGYIDTNYIKPTENGNDVFLVNRPTSWGFGTWKRCWDKVIWDIDTLKGIFRHKDIIYGFNKSQGVDMAPFMLLHFMGKVNSWSIRYHFAAYLNHSYTILPNRSLIENIGLDGSGTHSSKLNNKIEMMKRPVTIPDTIYFDKDKNERLKSISAPKKMVSSILYRLGLYTRLQVLFRIYAYKFLSSCRNNCTH